MCTLYTRFLSSLCFAWAELRKEGGGGDWEGGRRGVGGGVVGAREEEGREELLEGGFNLHMVFWPIYTGQELRQFRLYSQTNHALLKIGYGHRNKDYMAAGSTRLYQHRQGRQRQRLETNPLHLRR